MSFNAAVFDVPPDAAEIVAVVVAVTVLVEIVNVPVVFPAATVTEFGTVADPELLASVITNPELGAGDEIVTVPVLALPPTTVAGLSVSDLTVGAMMVNVALSVTEP